MATKAKSTTPPPAPTPAQAPAIADLRRAYDDASAALDESARRLAGIRTLLREAVAAYNDASVCKTTTLRDLTARLRQTDVAGSRQADELDEAYRASQPAPPAPRPVQRPPRRSPFAGPFGMDVDEVSADTAPDLSVIRRRS